MNRRRSARSSSLAHRDRADRFRRWLTADFPASRPGQEPSRHDDREDWPRKTSSNVLVDCVKLESPNESRDSRTRQRAGGSSVTASGRTVSTVVLSTSAAVSAIQPTTADALRRSTARVEELTRDILLALHSQFIRLTDQRTVVSRTQPSICRLNRTRPSRSQRRRQRAAMRLASQHVRRSEGL